MVAGGAERRRAELAAFLRKRRTSYDREKLAQSGHILPELGRAKSIGLRREEVAYLAGVSITWYTWLEQGRNINPSRSVLESLATTLALSESEREYALGLAGFASLPLLPTRWEGRDDVAPLPKHLQHLLDELTHAPSFVITPRWHIAGWNRAYELLYPSIARTAPSKRNLLYAVFTDPYVREMLPDWEHTSQQFLAEFRSDASKYAFDDVRDDLIESLRRESEHFARSWENHEVARFSSRLRTFSPPELGEMLFEQDQLHPADAPELRLVIYLPADDVTAQQLRRALA